MCRRLAFFPQFGYRSNRSYLLPYRGGNDGRERLSGLGVVSLWLAFLSFSPLLFMSDLTRVSQKAKFLHFLLFLKSTFRPASVSMSLVSFFSFLSLLHNSLHQLVFSLKIVCTIMLNRRILQTITKQRDSQITKCIKKKSTSCFLRSFFYLLLSHFVAAMRLPMPPCPSLLLPVMSISPTSERRGKLDIFVYTLSQCTWGSYNVCECCSWFHKKRHLPGPIKHECLPPFD